MIYLARFWEGFVWFESKFSDNVAFFCGLLGYLIVTSSVLALGSWNGGQLGFDELLCEGDLPCSFYGWVSIWVSI